MPTLVLPPRSTRDTEQMGHAAFRAGWETRHAPGYRIPVNFARDPVLYADVLFADATAHPLGLALLEPPDDFPARVPRHLAGRDITYTTLGEVRGLRGPYFVKPAEDKSFPARVYESSTELPDQSNFHNETPVIMSEPVIWEVEFRCFVLDHKVQTVSVYFRGGRLAYNGNAGIGGFWPVQPGEIKTATDFAASVLADERVPVPPAVVLDVGLIAGKGWAVVEANAVWGSGLYGCDAEAVLPALRRACIPRNSLTVKDSQWARPLRMIEE